MSQEGDDKSRRSIRRASSLRSLRPSQSSHFAPRTTHSSHLDHDVRDGGVGHPDLGGGDELVDGDVPVHEPVRHKHDHRDRLGGVAVAIVRYDGQGRGVQADHLHLEQTHGQGFAFKAGEGFEEGLCKGWSGERSE